jgi:hypothetical protein
MGGDSENSEGGSAGDATLVKATWMSLALRSWIATRPPNRASMPTSTLACASCASTPLAASR